MADMSEKKWYTITVQSGQEDKIKEDLENLKKTTILADHLFNVVIVKEEKSVNKVDKKTNTTKVVTKVSNMYKGIMFVEMILDDESWYIVRNKVKGVHGFVGSYGKGAKPNPLTEKEVEGILRMSNQISKIKEINFEVGDSVKVLYGPFANNEGIIEAMDETKQVATVSIFLLGRATPTEIEYTNLEKID